MAQKITKDMAKEAARRLRDMADDLESRVLEGPKWALRLPAVWNGDLAAIDADAFLRQAANVLENAYKAGYDDGFSMGTTCREASAAER